MDTNPSPAATPGQTADPMNMTDEQLRAALAELDITRAGMDNEDDAQSPPPAETPAAHAPADAGKGQQPPPPAEEKKADTPPAPPVAGSETTPPANPTPEDAAEEKALLEKLPAHLKAGSPEAKTWLDLRKGEARQAKTWQQINAEREKLKGDRAEAEKLREQIKAEQETRANTFSAEEYLDAAVAYRKQGREADARACEQEAASLKAGRADTLRARFDSLRQEEAQKASAWQLANVQAVKELPELADANSEATKVARSLVQANPALLRDPAGIVVAARMARQALELRAAQTERDTLRAKAEADAAEIRRLHGLASPIPGHSRGQRDDNGTPETADILAMCAELDAAGFRPGGPR